VVFTGASGPPPAPPDDGGPPEDGTPPPLDPPPLEPELPPEPSEPPLDEGCDDGIDEGIVGDGVDPGVGIDTIVGRPRQPPSANAHGASQASLVVRVRVMPPILPRPARPRSGVSTLSLV
jgi:hypothetical protein